MPDDTDAVVRLFAQEVPEIAAGIIEIKAIARRSGYRTKVAVHSHDPHLDCIGACVGVRGYHIKNLVEALGGERIDLVRWDDSNEKLISNALQPATIERVVLDSELHSARVIVRPDQVSLVEGRWGLNRELASGLCGWQIEVEEG
jgi:N utilization substance protein A